MKLDEFAFVNQQLAGMLQSGIPLEGALRQLCHTTSRGQLRTELELVEQALTLGTPLREALAGRKLPPFYSAMVEVGVQTNNLPAVLTLLADYYQRIDLTWTRLKGLMIYPLIVLGASLALSIGMALAYGHFVSETASAGQDLWGLGRRTAMLSPAQLAVRLWLPVGVLGVAFAAASAMLSIPAWRRVLRWHLPAFKEARLSQLASALSLMLQNGCPLNQALELLEQIEAGSPAEAEIQLWQSRLAAGHKSFPQLAAGGTVIPPLFVWLVAGSGEDWISGFKHAAEIYALRANQRIEIFLYAALPVSILGLGLLILNQAVPIARLFVSFMDGVSSFDDVGGM